MRTLEPVCRLASLRNTAAAVAACAYVAGLAWPLRWDVPLALFAASSLAPRAIDRRTDGREPRSVLSMAVLIFLLAMTVSIVFSIDVRRSAHLSLAFLPGTLLFLVVSTRFTTLRDARMLYMTLAAVALWLAGVVVWRASAIDWRTLHSRVADVGSPILVEANDVTFLAVIAPLSIVLIAGTASRAIRTFGALSVGSAICAICVLQSRTALLTLIVSVGSVVWLLRQPSRGRPWKTLLFVVLGVVLVDALLGFPLAAKFRHVREPRISLWIAAWRMFLDAPWLGHGAHTFVLLQRAYLDGLGPATWFPIERRTSPWAHNLYLEVLAEQGLVGCVALVFLLACAVRVAWRLQQRPSNDTRTLGAGALASLVAFCFAGLLELSFLRLWVVVVLFTLLGVISHLSSLQPRKDCES